jgi:predicted nucleic acid-binding protein
VTAVSNAGPLIALGKLGRLGLLLRLYGSLMIPSAVYHEVVTEGLRLGAPDASAVQLLIDQGHIVVVSITLLPDSPLVTTGIDLGEAEVITLAQREQADWVLIDNAHARRAARAVGLPLKGTIGVLMEGFRRGLLTLAEFELLIEAIRADPTLWISERLCEQALTYPLCNRA